MFLNLEYLLGNIFYYNHFFNFHNFFVNVKMLNFLTIFLLSIYFILSEIKEKKNNSK